MTCQGMNAMRTEKSSDPSRRRFLKLAGATLGSAVSSKVAMAEYRYLAPVNVENPLAAYPNRDWERIYRDIYRTDTRFTFLCCPNDTHNCLLNARWNGSRPPMCSQTTRTPN